MQGRKQDFCGLSAHRSSSVEIQFRQRQTKLKKCATASECYFLILIITKKA